VGGVIGVPVNMCCFDSFKLLVVMKNFKYSLFINRFVVYNWYTLA